MSRKLEEKQRRREAEDRRRKEQQRSARRRNLVTTIIILVVAAVVVALIVNERRASNAPVGVGEGEAGCAAEVQEFPEEGNNHVPDGARVQYNTTPPTSGDHYEAPADAGFYPPGTAAQVPDERFVHNLEHGQIVIWYDPTAPASVREDLDGYLDKQSGNQSVALLAVPYDQAPANITMTAWGAMQSCDAVSEDALDAFRERFQGQGPEQVGVPRFNA